MYEDDIKALNDWFANHTGYGTYHHTQEIDREDVYSVSADDMELFCYYLKVNLINLVSIKCMVGSSGIWFTSEDLKEARCDW